MTNWNRRLLAPESFEELRVTILLFWLAFGACWLVVPGILVFPGHQRIETADFVAVELSISKLYAPVLACFTGFYFGRRHSRSDARAAPSQGETLLAWGCCLLYALLCGLVVGSSMFAPLPMDRDGNLLSSRKSQIESATSEILPVLAMFLVPVSWITATGSRRESGDDVRDGDQSEQRIRRSGPS